MYSLSLSLSYVPSDDDLGVGAGSGRPLAAVDRPQLLAETRRLLVALSAHRVERRDLKTGYGIELVFQEQRLE